VKRSVYIKAVDTYAGTLYRIACTYCRQHADAEDIVQTAFMKLYQTETEFQDEEHIKRWLIRVTVNESRNLCKSFWKKNVTSLESSEMIQPYDFPRPEYSDLYDAVLSLPGKYKIVVHLYYYEDYSVKEIAEILSLKETTVQTQLMRARKQLKIKLKEVWQDEQ
jgi:RNA polymerase sigma factor, sigma-70 family